MSDKYSGEFRGVEYDELIGSWCEALDIRNIRVSEAVERGQLLSSEEINGDYAAAAEGDVDKCLVIACEDFRPTDRDKITQAYSSGIFNREKIKVAAGLDITKFENELRRQNIRLVSLKGE